MAQALITIDSTAGSNPPNGTAIVIGATVQLDNTNAGGEVSYLWEILDKPEGSLSSLSNATLQNPTFVADSEGTYLVKLTVNRTLATETTDSVIVGVAQVKTGMRIPAAGETTEESLTRGWAQAVNRDLQALDALKSDSSSIVGVSTSHTESKGHVLYMSGTTLIKAGLPGEEIIPSFSSALGTNQTTMDLPLFVFIERAGGGSTATVGQYLRAKQAGLVGPLLLGSGAAGDAVYVSDLGVISSTAGTYPRRVGTIAYVDGANYYLMFDGGRGHHEGRLNLLNSSSVIYQRTGSTLLNVVDTAEGFIVEFAGTNAFELMGDGTFALVGTDKRILGLDAPVGNNDAARKAYVDAAVLANAKSTLVFGNSATPNAATEAALDPGFCDRTAPFVSGSYPSLAIPFDCTISRLLVTAATGPAGAGLDVTVYKNGYVTATTCTLAIAGTSTSDTTHSFNASSGDLITVHVKGAGVVTSGAVDIMATLQVIPR